MIEMGSVTHTRLNLLDRGFLIDVDSPFSLIFIDLGVVEPVILSFGHVDRYPSDDRERSSHIDQGSFEVNLFRFIIRQVFYSAFETDAAISRF